MRILVTGASGVIGRRAIPLLIERGHNVTAAGRSLDRLESLERLGATPIALDLFDRTAVGHAVRGHDAVMNLATSVPAGARMFLPGAWRETSRLRREATAVLADAATAAGVGRFIQESFAPVYPDGGDRWITEDQPIRPARYNRAVADAEASVRRFTDAGGTGIVLRFALLYGPNDPFTNDLMANVRRGWLPVFGRASAYASFVTHADAAAAAVATLTAPAGAYNVVDDQPVQHRELGDILASLLEVAPPRLPPLWLTRLAGSLGETIARSLRISNARLRQATAWTPSVPTVREGFAAALGAIAETRARD